MKIVFLRHENLIDVCDTGRRNVPDVHLEFPRFSRSEFAPKAVALHARANKRFGRLNERFDPSTIRSERHAGRVGEYSSH